MVTDSAALVLFAIRSGLRLGQQIRQGFIDSTKRRELVLPLPRFFADVSPNDEASWFDSGDGHVYLAQSTRLKVLITKFGAQQPLTAVEASEVHECYREFHTLFLAERQLLPPATASGDGAAATDFPTDEIIAWIRIRQWAKGTDPNPSVLQRLAGTFIEIGVDYFSTMPGALRTDSAWGKALAGFLQAMDQIDFAEGRLADLPARLLVAGLETLSTQPELLAGDAKARELIQVTTQSLAKNVQERLTKIDAGDLPAQMRVKDWAELTFRSVLNSAGRLAVENPERFLGVSDAGQGALITHVGDAVLGFILDQPKLELDTVFSRAGLETVIRAALATLGEHPEILIQAGPDGLKVLLAQTAKELSEYDSLMTPDLLPELVRIVLEKTGQNLELLWPDLKNKPETNLALTAAKATLAALTQPIPGVRWKLRLTKQHLVEITDAVLDELVANPQWLLDQAGEEGETLEAVLRAVLKVLSQRGDERISPITGSRILQAVVVTAALRQEFIQKLPDGTQTLIVAALDLILAAAFNRNLDAKAAWQMVRGPVLESLTEITFRLLAQTKLDPAVLGVVKTVMKQETDALAGGELFTPESFEKRLSTALAA